MPLLQFEYPTTAGYFSSCAAFDHNNLHTTEAVAGIRQQQSVTLQLAAVNFKMLTLLGVSCCAL